MFGNLYCDFNYGIVFIFVSLEHAIKGKSSLKSKRVRTIFTPEQLERLEAEFERQQYMVGPERLYLAHTLQLTEAQVRYFSLIFTILNHTIKYCKLFLLFLIR